MNALELQAQDKRCLSHIIMSCAGCVRIQLLAHFQELWYKKYNF